MSKYIVAAVSEIKPGERKIVMLDGRSIGVFNVDGEFFALLNQCPHAGAALCEHGTIFGSASATEPGATIDYVRNRSIRCPWHQWEFDLRTGQSWYDPANARVRKYDVETLATTPDTPTSNAPVNDAQRLPGPHVMEGYEVTTSGAHVVVDTSRRRAGTQRNRSTTTRNAATDV